MTGRILVLGAAGRLGYPAAEAFREAGWKVTSLVRPGAAARAPKGTEVVEVDALDHAAVGEAARGTDVVLHALNPPYTEWSKHALPLAYSAITAAETVRRHADLPRQSLQLRHGHAGGDRRGDADAADLAQGTLRVAIEDRMEEAAERGVRTHHPARRRFFRRRRRIMVRSRDRQGDRPRTA